MADNTPKSIVVAALLTGAVGLGYKLIESPVSNVVNPPPRVSAEERERARSLATEAAVAVREDYRRERNVARSLLSSFGADQTTGIPRDGFTLNQTENQVLYLATDVQPLHDEIPYERVCSTLSSLPARAYLAARRVVIGQSTMNVLMRAHRWPSDRWKPTPEAIRHLTTQVAKQLPDDSARVETIVRYLTIVSRKDSALIAARTEPCLPPDPTIRVPISGGRAGIDTTGVT